MSQLYRKRPRCAFCGHRIWGTPRAYLHVYGNDPVLQCWTHNNAKPGREGCDQLLTKAITKAFVETKSITEAVAPYVKFDTRAKNGMMFKFVPDA